MSSDERSNVKKELGGLDAYNIAFETRNLEIGLFWQRSNYFLVLNAALAVGFFRIDDDTSAMFLAFLGAIVSVLWFRVNLGSKYWQARWERRLDLTEQEIAGGLDFFSASPDVIQKDVEDSFSHGENRKSCFQKWIEEQALKKPSVSHNMTVLSIVFIVAWGIGVIIRMF